MLSTGRSRFCQGTRISELPKQGRRCTAQRASAQLGSHFGKQQQGGRGSENTEPGTGNPTEEYVVQQVMEEGYDPEGLLGERAAPGKIKQNMHKRLMRTDEEYRQQQQEVAEQKRQELWEKRAARKVPRSDPAAMIEYLLDTENQEMSYEIGRCRAELDENFFQQLRDEISHLKVEKPYSERLQEREALLEVVEEGVRAVDERAEKVAAPMDRLRKLLSAEDKRDMLLEMVSNNEIDRDLVELLTYNAVSAESNDEVDKAYVMRKLVDGCYKYAILEDAAGQASDGSEDGVTETITTTATSAESSNSGGDDDVAQ